MEGKILVARDEYFEQILQKLISDTDSEVSLYICGKPGTGKTFTVDKVLEEIRRRKQLNRKFSQIIEINGMEISKSSDI